MFWPALSSSISSISSMDDIQNNETLKDKLMKNYSFSWNFGGLFSFLLGAIVLFLISDLNLIFDITLIFMGIAFIAALIFEEPTNDNKDKQDFTHLNEKKIKV